MKKLIKSTITAGILLLLSLGSVFAFADTVTISKLPEYLSTDNFKLSYSALSASPNVQFCYRKDGESYQTFGGVFTTSSDQVQVTGTQITEQAKYFFKVILSGSGCTGGVSDETSVIYDISGPDAPGSYSKEQVSPSLIRLHWRNPNNTDFSRVFIYRSENSNFSADDSTKVGEVGGAPDTDATWDNIVDASKTFYYALRAVDKAGNPSSLVADTVTTVVVETVEGTSETVVSLPSESGAGGSVLGDDSNSQNEEDGSLEGARGIDKTGLGEQAESSPFKKALNIFGTIIFVYILYRFFRRKR